MAGAGSADSSREQGPAAQAGPGGHGPCPGFKWSVGASVCVLCVCVWGGIAWGGQQMKEEGGYNERDGGGTIGGKLMDWHLCESWNMCPPNPYIEVLTSSTSEPNSSKS